MSNTKLLIADRISALSVINGVNPHFAGFKLHNASEFKNQLYLKKFLKEMAEEENIFINDKYIMLIYFNDVVDESCEVPAVETKVKVCTAYDKGFNFIKKGSLEDIAKLVGILKDIEYLDVRNIEENPRLFLEIYKNISCTPPQDLADFAIRECKESSGKSHSFLTLPKNPIRVVLDKERIKISELANILNVNQSIISNALSNKKQPKAIMEKLKEHYDYV